MHPDVGITREGFLDLKRGGRTISNTDRRKVNEKLKKMTREGAKNISKIDRTRVEEIIGSHEKYMNRHDGGMAKKTRTF
jgi:hypothetical protein